MKKMIPFLLAILFLGTAEIRRAGGAGVDRNARIRKAGREFRLSDSVEIHDRRVCSHSSI